MLILSFKNHVGVVFIQKWCEPMVMVVSVNGQNKNANGIK